MSLVKLRNMPGNMLITYLIKESVDNFGLEVLIKGFVW